MEIKLTLVCDECAFEVYGAMDEDGQVSIVPCETCIEDAREAAYDHGKEVGYDEGLEEGEER